MTLIRLLLTVSLLVLLGGCEPQSPMLRIGTPAPAFVLNRLDGATTRFPEQFANQVVAIRFWADWCPSCRSEMTALEPVYRQYHDRGLVILAVNVMQPAETVRPFVKQLGISYDVLLDAQGEVTRQYQVMALPATYIIDRKGTIRTRILGESTPETFTKEIADLL